MSAVDLREPVPAELRTSEFVLRPITADDAAMDHDAVMETREHLTSVGAVDVAGGGLHRRGEPRTSSTSSSATRRAAPTRISCSTSSAPSAWAASTSSPRRPPSSARQP